MKLLGNKIIKNLKWDSQFFGCRIGSVCLDQPYLADVFELDGIHDFDLVYLQNLCKIDDLDYVDERITYSRPINVAQYLEDERMKRARPNDYELLHSLALKASHESRFRKDVKIPSEKVDELYSVWLKKSLSKELADDVYYLSEKDRKLGFLTFKYEGAKARVGLIAVDENCRGQGLGRDLIKKVLNECSKRGMKELELSTQASNVGACKFYEALGFEIKKRTYVYHLWLNN